MVSCWSLINPPNFHWAFAHPPHVSPTWSGLLMVRGPKSGWISDHGLNFVSNYPLLSSNVAMECVYQWRFREEDHQSRFFFYCHIWWHRRLCNYFYIESVLGYQIHLSKLNCKNLNKIPDETRGSQLAPGRCQVCHVSSVDRGIKAGWDPWDGATPSQMLSRCRWGNPGEKWWRHPAKYPLVNKHSYGKWPQK